MCTVTIWLCCVIDFVFSGMLLRYCPRYFPLFILVFIIIIIIIGSSSSSSSSSSNSTCLKLIE